MSAIGSWARAALAVGVLAGCGEGAVTGLVLPVVPDNGAQFVAAQQAMVAVGCGLSGCHEAIVGNFKVTANPKSPATLDDEYTITKPFIDLDAPDDSRLLTVALAGVAQGHVICFADTEGCTWQIVTAWIAGEPPADAIDCTPTPSACFTGGE